MKKEMRENPVSEGTGGRSALLPSTEIGAGRRGSALVIVMCFSAILLITSLALQKMSTQSAFTVINFRKSAQALFVAEAGVADVLDKLAQNFDTYKSCTISNDLGDGSYVVTVTTNGGTGAIISSVGTYAGTTRETVLETLGNWQSAWNTNIFGKYGIFANGLIDGNGNGVLHSGIYSGDNIDIAPNVTIEGDVSSVGEVNNQGTVGGETNEYAEPIECPTFSFEYYKSLAGGDYIDAGGTVQFKADSPGTHLSAVSAHDYNSDGVGIVNHPSHVICVVGNVVIKNGATIKGAIVATGNIDMQGGHIDHIGFTSPDGGPLPSLMSINGDVRVRGGQTLNGFIYAAGDVELNGGDTVYGGVIAGGVVDARGDWQVYPGDGTVPPGINPGEGGEVTRVRIGAWLR